MELSGYSLTANWFDFCFENPEKITPLHSALYLFAVEHCNKLGWKKKFNLPTEMTKEAIGVKSWHTYIKAFNDLVDWGFFVLIERSKNQYSSNIIALSKYDEALDEALIKATSKHISKHISKQLQSNDSINKLINLITKNEELINKNIEKFEDFILSLSNLEKKEFLFELKDESFIDTLYDWCKGEMIILTRQELKTEIDSFISAKLVATDTNRDVFEYKTHLMNKIKKDFKNNNFCNQKPKVYAAEGKDRVIFSQSLEIIKKAAESWGKTEGEMKIQPANWKMLSDKVDVYLKTTLQEFPAWKIS